MTPDHDRAIIPHAEMPDPRQAKIQLLMHVLLAKLNPKVPVNIVQNSLYNSKSIQSLLTEPWEDVKGAVNTELPGTVDALDIGRFYQTHQDLIIPDDVIIDRRHLNLAPLRNRGKILAYADREPNRWKGGWDPNLHFGGFLRRGFTQPDVYIKTYWDSISGADNIMVGRDGYVGRSGIVPGSITLEGRGNLYVGENSQVGTPTDIININMGGVIYQARDSTYRAYYTKCYDYECDQGARIERPTWNVLSNRERGYPKPITGYSVIDCVGEFVGAHPSPNEIRIFDKHSPRIEGEQRALLQERASGSDI